MATSRMNSVSPVLPSLVVLILLTASTTRATAVASRQHHAVVQTSSHPPALRRDAVQSVTSISRHIIFLRAGAISMTTQTHFAFGANVNTVSDAKVEATVEKGQTVLTYFKKRTHKYGMSRSNVYVDIETVFDAFPGEAILEVKASFGDEVRTHRHIFTVIGLVLYEPRTHPPTFYTGKSGVDVPLSAGASATSSGYIELHAVVHVGPLDNPLYQLQRQDISFLLPSNSPIKWDPATCKITAKPSDLSEQCGLAFSEQFDRFYILRTDEENGVDVARIASITLLWKRLQQVYNDINSELGLKDWENQEIKNDIMTSFRVRWGSERVAPARWKIGVIVGTCVATVLFMIAVGCWCCHRRPSMSDLMSMQEQQQEPLPPPGLKGSKEGANSSFGFRVRDSICRSLFRIELDGVSQAAKADTPRPKIVRARVDDDDDFSVGDTVALQLEEGACGNGVRRASELESGETYVEPIDVPRERRGVREDLIGPSESIGAIKAARKSEGKGGGKGGGGIISQNLRELGAVIVEQQSYIKDRMEVLNMLQGPATRGVVGKHGYRLREPESRDEAKSSGTVRYQLSIPEIHQGSTFGKL